MLNLSYVIGNFGIFYINTTINTFFLIVFEQMGLLNPATVLGIGWILGAILQPFTGIVSDKYIKFGRKFFILAGVLICTFSLILLYEKRGFVIFNIILFYTGLHIYQIPLSAYIPDQVEKGKIQTISGLWNLSGGLGSVMAPLLGVILLNHGYNYIFLGLLVIIIGTTGLPLLYVREKHKQLTLNIRKMLVGYITNKNIGNFYVAKFLWWMGLGAYLPFIVNSLMTRGLSSNIAGIIYTFFMIFNCISSIFLTKLKIRDTLATLSHAIIGIGLCTFLIYISRNIYLIILLILISGIMYGVLIICSYKIMIEMIPQGEGGMYLGIDNIFLNIPQALSVFLVSITMNINNEIFLLYSSIFMSLAYIYILHRWKKSL